MKRVERKAEPVPGDVLLHDEWLTDTFPLLWNHMTDAKWDDGKPRKTSSVTVFLDQGVLKACLSDKHDGYVAFVSADSLEGLLDALEVGLRDDSLDWKKAKAYGGKR